MDQPKRMELKAMKASRRTALHSETSPQRFVNAQKRHRGCKENCNCLCHQPWTMRLALATCLGFTNIQVRGLPLLSRRCTQLGCDGPLSNVAIEAHFQLPGWLLSKAISIIILYSRWHEPCITFRVRNVLPTHNPWHNAIRIGDISRVRQLLNECPSRVNDVDPAGKNALLVRLIPA